MNFTPSEIKQIERLRKLERQWRWIRWAYLVLGAVSAVVLALNGYLLWSLIKLGDANDWPSPVVLQIAILWPSLLIKLAFAVYFPVSALTKWDGDPNRMLLLRLSDEKLSREDITSKNDAGPFF
jgi:hypothetical protein